MSWLSNLTAPSHASEWIAGVTGACGAILGSLVSIVWTAWYNARALKRERKEKFAAGTFAAYQKINQIYSISSVIYRHFTHGQSEAASKKQPACTMTMPMQRLSGPVAFAIDELWTLAQVSDSDLINRANSLDQALNSLQDAVDSYRSTRAEVWLKMPGPDSMDGTVGSVGLTEAQFRGIAPGIASLDHLISQIVPMASSIANDTLVALRLLVHAKARPLGKKFKVTLPDLSGQEVSISAEDAPSLSWRDRRKYG